MTNSTEHSAVSLFQRLRPIGLLSAIVALSLYLTVVAPYTASANSSSEKCQSLMGAENGSAEHWIEGLEPATCYRLPYESPLF